MNLLHVFQLRSKWFYMALVLLAMVSSLTSMGILMLVNQALGGKSIMGFGHFNYLAFIVLISISFFTTRYFQNYMVELTNGITFNMELSIIQKVRNASYESFEHLGHEKIYAAIGDARILSRVPEILVTLVTSSVTLICCLFYVFWISVLAGFAILVIMVGLFLIYFSRNNKIEKDLNRVRDLQDVYYRSLRELMNGFKQIRISSLRNNNLFNKHIFINRNKTRSLSVKTSRKYVVNELIGSYSWYIVLGIILFVLPVFFKINTMQLTSFILTILFMMSPVSQLILFFPFYTSFKIAIERIDKIDKDLSVNALPEQLPLAEMEDFESIRFENVSYKYKAEGNASFELSLADLSICREEVLFVVGGNGSGKSTFINILTGLCKPEGGKIFINEREVSWEEFSAFANRMAVVYTDHHLFKENLDDHDLSEKNPQFERLRDKFNLNGILKIDAANGNVDKNLSKGQQKRLALLMALMEKKPILILDEWAAEQDPQNRRYFYTEWLEAIREMGITIIAVSHDDDFYHLADRVIKFNYGKIAGITDSVREII